MGYLTELLGRDVAQFLLVVKAVGRGTVRVLFGAVELGHRAGERGHILLHKAAESYQAHAGLTLIRSFYMGRGKVFLQH